jgi:hypothetical protein
MQPIIICSVCFATTHLGIPWISPSLDLESLIFNYHKLVRGISPRTSRSSSR